MLIILYNLVTQIYFLGIKLAGFQNEKARLWVQGRIGIFERFYQEILLKRTDNQRLVWMHCASLGEFEQGRTVLESLKQQRPEVLILLTFFSPSGYEIRKDYPIADWVFYLPSDSKPNAQRFLSIVQPDLAIFVKYEFWYHYLCALKKNRVPTLLISGIFRKSHPFFKWYGSLHREMLSSFSQILVQDGASKKHLQEIGIHQVKKAGDGRVDRVLEIAKHPTQLPLVRSFCGETPVLVCGSTWPADEAMLNPIFSDEQFADWKFILAPHDVQLAHIQAIESSLKVPHLRFSQLENMDFSAARVLIIDNIGLLSSLYAFGKIAYIGGGFGQGIHNTLEPAAHGLPVIFGPNFAKFEEAVWLVEHGGGFVVRDSVELKNVFNQLKNRENCVQASIISQQYVLQNKGATQFAMEAIDSLISW